MRKYALPSLLFLLASLAAGAQADRLTGYWLTEEGESQVEIFTGDDGKFYGRLVWLDEPYEDDGSAKVDKENPDRALRNRPLIGLEILRDFSYDASDDEWKGGSIYDPENGRTYSAYMRLEDENTLRLRGYVMGMRFIGRTTMWTRERQLRE